MKYNFSDLPLKLLGETGCFINECYSVRDFDIVNIGDIVEYNGEPTWNRLQELEIERRKSDLNCNIIIWEENRKVLMKFIDK